MRYFLSLLISTLLITHNAVAAERVLGKQGSYEALASDNFSCSNPSLVIRSSNKDKFTGDTTELQRFAGLLRAALGFECPSLNRINITGETNGKTVYQGNLSASNNWRLQKSTSNHKEVAKQKSSSNTQSDSAKYKPKAVKGKEIWRFKLICGRETTRGFFNLNIKGISASATFESIARYPNIGYLNANGGFDKNTRKLNLQSAGFVAGKPQMTPVDISATISGDGNSMSGTAQGSQSCSSFNAWLTAFDTRRNSSGVITKSFGGISHPAKFQFAIRKLSTSDCEIFVDWYADAQLLKTVDGAVTSAIVESDKMLDALGFTYESMKDREGQAFTMTVGECRKKLKQSASTKHSQLLAKFEKAYRSSADHSPYVLSKGGKSLKVGNREQINYYWYQNLYVATAIRDARALTRNKYAQVKNLPKNFNSFKAIEKAISDGQSKSGLLASLPQKDRDQHISKLRSIQNEISSIAVNEKIGDIDWSIYQPTIKGINRLNSKHREVKGSFGRNINATEAKKIDDVFASKRNPLSKELTDSAISSYPSPDASLKGLRSHRKESQIYMAKYQSVLNPNNRTRLSNHISQSYSKTVAKSYNSIGNWLESEVSQDEAGLNTLNQIAQDIFGMGIKSLENRENRGNLQQLADALLARQKQIKVEECIVPEGFEEMRDTICSEG